MRRISFPAKVHVPPPEPPEIPDTLSNKLDSSSQARQPDSIMPIKSLPLDSTPPEDDCAMPEDMCSVYQLLSTTAILNKSIDCQITLKYMTYLDQAFICHSSNNQSIDFYLT